MPKKPKSKLTPEERVIISELLRSAAESNIREKRKIVDEQKATEQIGSQMTEYFDSFILLGYTFEGNPVEIVFASTTQQADSLTKLVVNFVQQGI